MPSLESGKLLQGQAMSDTLHCRIGEAARRSGVSAANIRYYEKEGLLPAQSRADNQYRLYNDDEVHRLRFVRLCRAMDMSLDEVRTLLALDQSSGSDAHAACATLDEHLSHVRTRLDELRTLESELLSLRGRCDGRGGHCHVIEALHERADAEPVPPPQAASHQARKRHV
ncbi:hypothetical protein SDC9_152788 [bioreactor metagenome]|uniref:HTH merR-type domain-containing protein n=1 Tax=bioreactor metagenome TaxID=1076179 RepID=A0A645EUK7_9ZZZZ